MIKLNKLPFLLGAALLTTVASTSKEADAAWVLSNEVFYICTLHVGNNINLIELNSAYGCSGISRGYVIMNGPGSGKTSSKLWSASRFDLMTKWLLDNRWSGFSVNYDTTDMATTEITQVSTY